MYREAPTGTSVPDLIAFLLDVVFQVPITDPAQLAEHLFLQHETYEKLSFPDGIDETLEDEPSVS